MKITRTYVVSCCDHTVATVEYEHDALEKMLNHIRKRHPVFLAKINTEARRQAKSQNGCGYFDGNKPSGDGWHKAQSTFREAWRIRALKTLLNFF